MRNVYFELEVVSDIDSLTVTVSPVASSELSIIFAASGFRRDSRLAKLDADGLRYVDGSWKLSVEWEAIQPQRTRLIKPILYVYAQRSMNLTISAKVFADSFPEPLKLTASATFEVREKTVNLDDVLPNWEKLLEEEGEMIRSANEIFTNSVLARKK